MTTPTMLHVEPKRPKRRTLFFRVLWSLFAVVVGVCLFWTYSYYTALWERDALIAEIRAKGEPVWWEELCAKLAKESPPNSGAPYILKAIEKLPPSARPGQLRVRAYKTDKRISESFSEPRIDPEIQSDLGAFQESLALLEEAVKRPPGFLSASYLVEKPLAQNFSHLELGREITRLLRWKIYDALGRGDAREAFKTVGLGMKVSEQFRVDAMEWPSVMRWGMRAQHCNRLVDCLRFHATTDSEFCELDNWLSSQDARVDQKAKLAADRATWMTLLGESDQLRGLYSPYTFTHLTPSERVLNRRWLDVVASPFGRPVVLKTQAEFLRATQRMLAALELPIDPAEPKRIVDRYVANAPLVWTIDNHLNIAEGPLPSFETWFRVQWKLIFARLALRLRRHYDSHGRFPDSLDGVCDESMPRIPVEWFLGHALVYKPRMDGFILDVPEAAEHRKGHRLKAEDHTVSLYGIDFKFVKPTQGPTK